MSDWDPILHELESRRTHAAEMGGPERVARHRASGKLDARQRVEALFDEGTLELISEDDGSGMLAAVGKVEGAPVVAFCSDATVMGGAMGAVGCKVVVHSAIGAMFVTESALRAGAVAYIEKGVSPRSIVAHLNRVAEAGTVRPVRPYPLSREYPAS